MVANGSSNNCTLSERDSSPIPPTAFLDNLRLKQLTPLFVEGAWADILMVRSKQTKTLLEKATLEKIRSLLKQILSYGYRHDLILFDLNKIVLKFPMIEKFERFSVGKRNF